MVGNFIALSIFLLTASKESAASWTTKTSVPILRKLLVYENSNNDIVIKWCIVISVES